MLFGSRQKAKHTVVLPPGLSMTNPHDILQAWITERGNWQRKRNLKCSREIKSDNIKSEIPIQCKELWNK